MSKNLISTTKKSKISLYKLEDEIIKLYLQGYSYQKIADIVNDSGILPEGEKIDKFVVARFINKINEVKEVTNENEKQRLLKVVNTNFDIYYEVNQLFGKTKAMLEFLEEDAAKNNKSINPYAFKALVGEMRELLKQMTEIQKEINDYKNVKKFLEIVIQTLKEEVPEKLPIIAEKLKIAKETRWFADILNRKKDSLF